MKTDIRLLSACPWFLSVVNCPSLSFLGTPWSRFSDYHSGLDAQYGNRFYLASKCYNLVSDYFWVLSSPLIHWKWVLPCIISYYLPWPIKKSYHWNSQIYNGISSKMYSLFLSKGSICKTWVGWVFFHTSLSLPNPSPILCQGSSSIPTFLL